LSYGLRYVQVLSCGAHLPLGAAPALVRKVFRAAIEADSTNAKGATGHLGIMTR
jgi:hypothetical protein